MGLLPILFPQGRAQILRLLFADPARELHLRDLTRQAHLGLGTIQSELETLSAADLVTSRRDGNRRYYRANSRHPLYHELQQVVLKTSGLREVLAEALQSVKGVDIAFVFGSLAAGPGKAASDVDLFVIGQAGLRALAPVTRRAADTLGREINAITMTAEEFRSRRLKGEAFLADVLTKQKLFVKGGPDELERVG